MARDRLAAMRAQQQGGGNGGYGGYGGNANNGYGDHAYPSQRTGQYDQGGYGQQPSGYGQQPSYPEPNAQSYGGQQQPYAPQPAAGGYGQQQGGYGQNGYDNGAYEMQGMNERPAAGGDMNAFFSDISEIQDTIRLIDDNINRISELHSRSLNNMDEASSQQAHSQLAGISQETSKLTNGVKNSIKKLEVQTVKMPESGDKNVRKTQIGAVKNRFKETIQRYQTVEHQYRQKYRQRAERQYKIVKPDATPQEVKAALDDDQGGQIFSQALLNSNRHGEARGALREVQERHEDIKKIERTITELAQLFNEMDILITEQDEQFNVINTQAENVETDMNQGLQATGKAVVSARKARKKRWICFWIIIILIVIVAIIVAVVVCTNGNRCGRGSDNGNSNPARRALQLLDRSDEWAQVHMGRAFGDYGLIGA